MHDLIGKLFNTCYNAFYNDCKTFCDVNSVTNRKTVDNFLKRLKKAYNINSIGEQWLRHYFRFQFAYWLDKENVKRKISLQWILGKKAFDRYQKYMTGDNVDKINYYIEKNTSFIIFDDEKSTENNDYEDQHRAKYLNKDIGLLWCIHHTSLYKKSPICFRCKFRNECKELLKINYPLLYKKRCLQ